MSKKFLSGITILNGNLIISNINNDVGDIITRNSSNGVISERTPSQLLGDIGGAPISGSTFYIQNQFSLAQSSSEAWLSGRFQAGNLRIDTNTITSENTNGNILLSPNGTGSVIVNSNLLIGTQENKATITYATNTARTLTIPNLGGNRTFSFIDENETITGTKIFSNTVTINNTLSLRATAATIPATQIPVFTSDPSSTTRLLQTRTPLQLLTDILTVTTIGNSGASIYDITTGNLNIPEYTLNGLGGAPESGSARYIQNQFSSAQSSSEAWLSGRFQAGNLRIDINTISSQNTNGNIILSPNGTGKVGIGTTSPSALLDVNGDSTINGLNIGRGGGNIDTNTRVGRDSLFSNTIGSQNTAIGRDALRNNTTGNNNTAIGRDALRNNTIGGTNTAIGQNALFSNTGASNNTAIGFESLHNSTTSGNNTAIGFKALFSDTSSGNNTAIGFESLRENIGTSNTAIGVNTLRDKTTGNNNTAIGRDAGRFIADGTTANAITANSVFIGFGTKALANNQTNQIVIGDEAIGNGSNSVTLGNTSITKTVLRGNVGIGTTSPSALLDVNGDSIINGLNIGRGAGNIDTNTRVGRDALISNTIGGQNTAIGSRALFSNTTGNQNTAIGRDALFSNTTGINNTAIGFEALFSNTTGINNTAIGRSALLSNTTGGQNTAIGSRALFSNTTGGDNTAIGINAGRFIADGTTANAITNNSVFIGFGTKALANDETNQIVIGYDAIGNGSNSVTLGNTSITKTVLRGNVGIGTTSPTNTLDINGTLRIRTINNGSGDFITVDSNGVITKRTSNETLIDIDAVPYSGATKNVILGEYGLLTNHVNYSINPVNLPTTKGTTYWDVDDNTLATVLNGYIMKHGEDLFYPVKNQTGQNIPKGTSVRFAGTLGMSGRLLIEPFIADGSIPSTFFMGVTAENIADGDDGKVLWFGRIRGINTNSFEEGDILYASTTVLGGFQTTIPKAPNNIIQIAAVITKSDTLGVIFIRPILGSNINKDEGINITSGQTGDILQLQANNIWENKTKAQYLGGTSSQFVKGDGTLDSTIYTPTGRTLTISGTTNQITVSSPNTQDLGADRTWILSLPQNIHTDATPTFSGLTINGNINLRASSTTSAATQIPVFTADPSSTTRTLVTRTPSELLGDIGGSPISGSTFYIQNQFSSAQSSSEAWLSGRFQAGNLRIDINTISSENTNGNIILSPNGTGNVGIGTTTPSHILTVNAPAATGVNLIDLRSTASAQLQEHSIKFGRVFNNRFFNLQYITSSFGTASNSTHLKYSFNEDGDVSDNILVISSLGRVGIGTTSPNELLEVAGNIHLSGGDRTIFNRSNNALSIGTNNTERIRITNTGNVGIGTTTPDSKLQVDGDVNLRVMSGFGVTGSIQLNRSDNVNRPFFIEVFNDSISANNYMRFKVHNGTVGETTDVMSLRGDGKVGIGTTTPNELLEVAGNIHLSGGDRTIFNRSNNALSIGTNNTERIRITNTGNVGIGTTTPNKKLDLLVSSGDGISVKTTQTNIILTPTDFHSAFYIGNNLSYNGSGEPVTNTSYINAVGGNNRGGTLLFLRSNSSTARGLYIYTAPDSTGAGDPATLTEQFRITPNEGYFRNRLGINTVSPTNTLDVNGTARIRTINNGIGDIITTDSNGVLGKRTPSELLGDIGGAPISGSTFYIQNQFSSEQSSSEAWLSGRFQAGNLRLSGNTITSENTDGNILLSPNGTGKVGIGTTSPTNTLDINGTLRVRTINNLGTTSGNILVRDSNGVISSRTTTEIIEDFGGLIGRVELVSSSTGVTTTNTYVSVFGNGTNITTNQLKTIDITKLNIYDIIKVEIIVNNTTTINDKIGILRFSLGGGSDRFLEMSSSGSDPYSGKYIINIVYVGNDNYIIYGNTYINEGLYVATGRHLYVTQTILTNWDFVIEYLSGVIGSADYGGLTNIHTQVYYMKSSDGPFVQFT